MARAKSVSWRSARWQQPQGAGGLVIPAAPDTSLEPLDEGQGSVNPVLMEIERDLEHWPWHGVRWSIPYVCFLLYFWAITSYQAPIGMATMATALLMLPLSKEKLTFGPFMMAFLAFFAMAAIGWGVSPWKAYTGEEFTNLEKYVAICFVGVSVLTDRRRIRFFSLFYAVVFGLYPMRGTLFNYFIYHATEFGRAAWNNLFSNPNEMAMLMFFPLALSLGALATEKRKLVRQGALAGVCLVVLVLFLSQSRGALIALFVGALLLFTRRKKGRAAMFGGLVVVSIVVAVFAPSDVWDRMSNITSAAETGNLKEAKDNGSADQRMAIWKVAMSVAKDNLAVGAGWAGYPFEHVFRSKMTEFSRNAQGMRDAHSTYFTLIAEVGLPGSILFLLMFAVVGLKCRRARKKLETILPGQALQLLYLEIGMLCYMMAAVFATVLLFTYTYLQLAVMYAIADQADRDAEAIIKAGGVPSRPALRAA